MYNDLLSFTRTVIKSLDAGNLVLYTYFDKAFDIKSYIEITYFNLVIFKLFKQSQTICSLWRWIFKRAYHSFDGSLRVQPWPSTPKFCSNEFQFSSFTDDFTFLRTPFYLYSNLDFLWRWAPINGV